jgi:outer membrane protein insertion porin family
MQQNTFKYLIGLIILLTGAGLNPVFGQSDSSLYEYHPYNYNNPKEYVINVIRVEGNVFVETPLVVIFSNLSVGQVISVPGNEISQCLENLWKKELFSDVKLFLESRGSDSVDVIIVVKERSRLSKFAFPGLKKSEAKSLRDQLSLKGNMIITENLLNQTKKEIYDYYHEKGYYEVKADIKREKDPDKSNAEIFRIHVTKGQKVKVQDIVFTGNTSVPDKTLRKTFKNTKRKKQKINIFKSSKFIQNEYDEDKLSLIRKYNSLGYRDAYIVSDSVQLINSRRVVVKVHVNEGQKYFFRNITFSGNVKYSDEILHRILDINKGDVYNQSKLEEKIYGNMEGGFDISGLYMDDGYLFFNATPVETNVEGDSIDLDIKIYEGDQATYNRILIAGNYKTSDFVILREIRTRPGQKFSRSDIQRSVRELSNLGLFDPAQINVVPKPNVNDGTVDIEYTVVERASDQIELSGGIGPGWGGTQSQFVGTLGLVLNNFSSRKLLKPKMWNPIPAGDGQKLSLRGQASMFFEAYNFSFTEPWMGGKKPNSFTASIYHSVFNMNARPKGDPLRQVMYTTGASVALGKRLRWPDDNFNIQYSAGYQVYEVQNFGGGLFPFENGKARSIEMKAILSRNSLEGGFIFPTGGSNFTLSLAATPPLSLFSDKDYTDMPAVDKYKWLEYHKWKFDAEYYLKPFNKAKFVLATRARMGMMSYYNSDLGFSPFERFLVGGSGLSGFNFYGTEIIAQRGYDEGSISSNVTGSQQLGATMFSKYSLELRFPITDNPNATVYLLSFLEAGNAWVGFDRYDFFNLKRAGGMGIRLFLPMFGLIGVDYGYGWDWQSVRGTGKPGHFHFYLGQQF